MEAFHLTPRETRNFWAKVQRSDACWVWTGYKQSGYGRLFFRYKPMLAHRLSWAIANGRLPQNEICHRCDNPSCVRPTHLWEGSHRENMADMRLKGRLAPICQPSLNAAQVIAIRELRDSGSTHRQIADSLGLPLLMARNAAVGNTYAHVSAQVCV